MSTGRVSLLMVGAGIAWITIVLVVFYFGPTESSRYRDGLPPPMYELLMRQFRRMSC